MTIRINWQALTLILFLLLLPIVSGPVQAKEQYAVETGKGCIFCHQENMGGPLKPVGFAYIRNGYQYPVPDRILEKAVSLHTLHHRTLRFIIGYLHLLAAVVFFGAIFYIHIFVRPSRLLGGIPKHERILGVSCMITLGLTGAYLTWMRIDRWEQLFNNTFGLMLLIKILLFLLMVTLGGIAITTLHRRMQKAAKAPEAPPDKITPSNLGYFDGTGGKPAYVMVETKVYDVTENPRWKEGRHLGRHVAGMDLTGALKGAPHGPEVLDKMRCVGEISEERTFTPKPTSAQKIFTTMAYTNLILVFLILGCISVWRWDLPVRLIPEGRADILANTSCMECHQTRHPGVHADWQASVHAKVGVGCYDCHNAPEGAAFVSTAHLEYDSNPIAAVVTPRNCGGCHPDESAQYEKSKHAHTHEIMWKVDRWLNDGMNNAIERTTGCYACHGTVVKIVDGRPVEGTWPNVGVGRVNPDGSLGSCSSCHTRHKFSVVEARKPEACDQCHLGPDHPQIEIYNESKHGTIYHAEGDSWTWNPDDRRWQAGRDFRAPTCAVCHMSAADEVPKTHDVTERLSWETQAPMTVRPSEFKPFPAQTDWKEERSKMKRVCLQCHSQNWTDDHFSNLDRVVRNYNELYFKPIKGVMDNLYDRDLLSREEYFDEALEWAFYEFWHHEGRRARFGAAMMAPDYAWWHGFYEMKHRFNTIVESAERLRKEGTSPVYEGFPGRYEE